MKGINWLPSPEWYRAPKFLLLSDSAQGVCVLEGNTQHRVMASDVGRPGVQRPFALHIMSSKQPERAQLFLLGMDPNHIVASMHHQSEEERPASDTGQLDSRIVPQQRTVQIRETKLGNSSEGLYAGSST